MGSWKDAHNECHIGALLEGVDGVKEHGLVGHPAKLLELPGGTRRA
jgi:hypothetical protein